MKRHSRIEPRALRRGASEELTNDPAATPAARVSIGFLCTMEDAAAQDDSAPIATIGRYVLYGPMAAGGIATVHFARSMDDEASPVVAVKRLHARYAQDPAFATMFADEARIAARIRDPNVIEVFDVVKESGVLFLVMPYVHGESLAKIQGLMRRHRDAMPPAVATAILLDMLHGLHAAHETRDDRGQLLDIVHRDVSPQNVMIGVDGVARLFDFGVAKAQGRLTSTRQGEVKGKYPYMAPEQIHGRKVTPRSDVYASGVVLWEALTGTRLFGGSDRMKIMERVLFAPIPPPSATRPEIGTAFDDLALQALDRDPDKRFASAKEMRDALEKAHPRATPAEVRAFIEETAVDTINQRAHTISEIRARSPSIDAELVKEEIIGGFDVDRPTDYDEDSHLETVKAPTPFAEVSETKPRLASLPPLTVVETVRPNALEARPASGERVISREPRPASEPPQPATPSSAPAASPVATLVKSDWGIVLLLLAFIVAAVAGAALAYLH
jgi:serine/threonine-protein kinase